VFIISRLNFLPIRAPFTIISAPTSSIARELAVLIPGRYALARTIAAPITSIHAESTLMRDAARGTARASDTTNVATPRAARR